MTNFIDGGFQTPIANSQENQVLYIDSVNPATGAIYAQIPNSTHLDVEEAVQAASRAFEGWANTPRTVRSQFLMKIADAIEQRLTQFAVSESHDQGKPVALAASVDIPRAIHNFRFFATSILHNSDMARELDQQEALSYVHKSPTGVAALISPWNLPLYLLTWKIAPCIASGCTCVCKPSEFTSVTAFMLCQVLRDVGLPAGVVNIVFGTGEMVGAPLVAHPSVPLVSFTGGTATGELIYKAAATGNKKLSLELGGKNANIVFEDADLQEAIATSIRSSFANQGEICLCGSRIFVQETIYQQFVDGLCERASKLCVGNPEAATTDLGALVSLQHLRKVQSYIEVAKSEGASVLLGGQRPTIPGFENGFFFQPTIIVGVHPTASRLQKEEIFGPVVTITPFKTEDEAVRFANSTEYGLSASIWTQNVKRAHRVAQRLHVGTCWVNCWMVRDLNMPFGGVKKSGLGREGRSHSMEFFCEEKTICLKL